MTKSQFIEMVNGEGLEFSGSSRRHERINSPGSIHITEHPVYSFSGDMIEIHPENDIKVGPYFGARYTRIFVPSRTSTPWTKANAEFISGKLDEYRRLWKRELSAFKKTPKYRELKRKADFFELAIRAGLDHDEHGGYGRGDHFELRVIEHVWRKPDLRKYHASGRFIGFVSQERTRVYAKSSDWRPSSRKDKFVVGENESGTPFVHQVPSKIESLDEAMEWIWQGVKIEDRQGDVAVTAGRLKHVEGEDADIAIHDSHRFIGEVHVNGSTHVRNGFLYHTREQHPTIYIGSEWKRIVIGRRSAKGMSSAD